MKTKVWLAGAATLLLLAAAAVTIFVPTRDTDPRVVPYDASMPNLQCLEGRVIAESRAGLSGAQRRELWRQYGLHVSFEWVSQESGFTYHELEIKPYYVWDKALALVTRHKLAPRTLKPLVDVLNEDPRIDWAAPDALILEWAQSTAPSIPPGEELLPELGGRVGVSLLTPNYRPWRSTLEEWAKADDVPPPYPDFEYYRKCDPDGTLMDWDESLMQLDQFQKLYRMVYGTGERAALADYQDAGSPTLAPVTVCVADTGVLLNHPDLAGRLHPNAIDGNYRNYGICPAGKRPGPDDEITDRNSGNTAGLPRPAVRGKPASHGTSVAGLVARCTAGFKTTEGEVRILPASIKSEKTVVFTGLHPKSPISSFIKVISALNEYFPVGNFTPKPGDAVQNTGDVRVVTTSASVPKAMFSDAEWRVVANLAGKAAGSIAEDLRSNDRLYLFAAGNEMQGVPNKPGDMDYVLCVSATMAYDGSAAWQIPLVKEGSNLGEKCVSAPGYGIITSTIYPCPNLKYLPEDEFREPRKCYSVPKRDVTWVEQTNSFSATSSATPQVAALAALMYAQAPNRDHMTVIQLIQKSCNGRRNRADWGESLGLVDYQSALDWPNFVAP